MNSVLLSAHLFSVWQTLSVNSRALSVLNKHCNDTTKQNFMTCLRGVGSILRRQSKHKNTLGPEHFYPSTRWERKGTDLIIGAEKKILILTYKSSAFVKNKLFCRSEAVKVESRELESKKRALKRGYVKSVFKWIVWSIRWLLMARVLGRVNYRGLEVGVQKRKVQIESKNLEAHSRVGVHRSSLREEAMLRSSDLVLISKQYLHQTPWLRGSFCALTEQKEALWVPRDSFFQLIPNIFSSSSGR